MTKFANQVYNLLCQVPGGRVTSYKALAEAMNTRAYQAIGQIMKRNPNAPQVPCHRVVKSNGQLGGFMGEKSGVTLDRKVSLLEKEGVMVRDGKVINFEQVFFNEFKSI